MTLAIIGAGPSGLVAAHEAVKAGLNVTVFEAQPDLGGVWHPGSGKVWGGMRTNLSHFHMGFSGLPWPENTPDFPDAQQVFSYLQNFAAQNKLRKTIAYNQTVGDITQAKNKWRLTVGKQRHCFDHLILANGVFNQPSFPALAGIGKIKHRFHSQDYKRGAAFKNGRVTVIGGSYSGYEIAADLAKSGAQVDHVFRKPGWIMPRIVQKDGRDIPFDLASYVYPVLIENPLPPAQAVMARRRTLEAKFGNPGAAHPALAMDTQSADPFKVIVSDDYRQHVTAGLITPHRGEIEKFSENTVTLGGGESWSADAVIFCTGYQAQIPWQDAKLASALGYDESNAFQPLILNKSAVHPGYKSLGFTGLYRGPYFGVMEMQARWIAGLFSRRFGYPGSAQSDAALAEENRIRRQKPRPHFPHSDYVGYMLAFGAEMNTLPGPLLHSGEPMLPSDFLFHGPGADPLVAAQRRARLHKRLAQEAPRP